MLKRSARGRFACARLLLGHRYTHEITSAITDQMLAQVEKFRRGPLPEEMAFVYLDGFFLKVLREGVGAM